MRLRGQRGPEGSTWLDEDAAARVQAVTLDRYRLAAQKFCSWCTSSGHIPLDVQDWDDFMLIYKSEAQLSRAAFTYLVAAVEFYHSRFKGSLSRCHASLDRMGISNATKHTLPLLSSHACLFCSHFACLGYARLGGGLVFQQRRGLRPGEMLSLRPEDLAFSE